MSTPIWNKLVEQFIHSDEETKNTVIAKTHSEDLIPFNSLCKKEGCKRQISSKQNVIYLDSVAKKEIPVSNPSSMDFMHSVVRRGSDGSKGKKIIISECRFRYDNIFNIRTSDLEEKIKGTKSLMDEDISLVLDKCIFLFNEKVINQAINHLMRLKPNGSWIAVTATEYEQLFHD